MSNIKNLVINYYLSLYPEKGISNNFAINVRRALNIHRVQQNHQASQDVIGSLHLTTAIGPF